MAANLNSNTKKLIDASIDNDDLASLINFIESKNIKTCGNYALKKALEQGKLEIAMGLVIKGVDLNISSSNGTTTLMLASYMGNTEAVTHLLHFPSLNLNSKRLDNGMTALMLAIRMGHTEIAEQLLQKNLDINEQDNTGMTALMLACTTRNLPVVRILIGKRADTFKARYRDGANALAIAMKAIPYERHGQVYTDFTEIVELLKATQRNQAADAGQAAGGGPKRKTRRAKKTRRSKPTRS
jgi:ankyrin repeat protein